MRFLVDADLPRSATSLLRQRGHDAEDVRDIGLGSASDKEIAAYARDRGLCLVTGDFGFADLRSYPAHLYAGIVVLQLPRNATAALIVGLLDSLLRRPRVLADMPGRLAIVAPGSVRLRPPLRSDLDA
jgi:predicted nuclease of predicted toxin-antitoxin system